MDRDLGTSLQPIATMGPPARELDAAFKDPTEQSRVDRNAWLAAGVSFVVGLALISSVVALRALDQSPPLDGAKKVGSAVGWLGALGAVIVFGSNQLLVRLNSLSFVPSFEKPLFLGTFSALGNGIGNLALAAAFRYSGLLKTPPSGTSLFWGFLGALDVNLCQVLVAAACQLLGSAVAAPMWCGLGIAVSFIWGSVGFQEPIKNVFGAVCGLVALAGGICITSSAQSVIPTKIKAWLYNIAESPQFGRPAPGALRTGLLCTIAMGVIDGSLMAPYKLFVIGSDTSGSAASELTYVYIEAFGIMVLAHVPVFIFLQALLWRARYGTFAGLLKAWRACLWPGFWTGVFWAMGNACSVHASEYLGVALGFPLTQACVVVCSLWGVVLFGEMRSCQAKVACTLGIAVVLAGTVVLSMFGQ